MILVTPTMSRLTTVVLLLLLIEPVGLEEQQ